MLSDLAFGVMRWRLSVVLAFVSCGFGGCRAIRCMLSLSGMPLFHLLRLLLVAHLILLPLLFLHVLLFGALVLPLLLPRQRLMLLILLRRQLLLLFVNFLFLCCAVGPGGRRLVTRKLARVNWARSGTSFGGRRGRMIFTRLRRRCVICGNGSTVHGSCG